MNTELNDPKYRLQNGLGLKHACFRRNNQKSHVWSRVKVGFLSMKTTVNDWSKKKRSRFWSAASSCIWQNTRRTFGMKYVHTVYQSKSATHISNSNWLNVTRPGSKCIISITSYPSHWADLPDKLWPMRYLSACSANGSFKPLKQFDCRVESTPIINGKEHFLCVRVENQSGKGGSYEIICSRLNVDLATGWWIIHWFT